MSGPIVSCSGIRGGSFGGKYSGEGTLLISTLMSDSVEVSSALMSSLSISSLTLSQLTPGPLGGAGGGPSSSSMASVVLVASPFQTIRSPSDLQPQLSVGCDHIPLINPCPCLPWGIKINDIVWAGVEVRKSDCTAGRSGWWSASAVRHSILMNNLFRQVCLVGGMPAIRQASLWHAPRPGGIVLSQLGQVHK